MEGDHQPYWVPYSIGAFTLLAFLYVGFEIGHYYICKHVFGREDPIDPDALLAGLSDDQRKQAQSMIVSKASNNTSTSLDPRTPRSLQPAVAPEELPSDIKTSPATEEGETIETGGESQGLDIEGQESRPVPEDTDEELGVGCEEESDENVCPICLSPFDETDSVFASKQCSHKFHADCILEWLHTKDHNDCPVCRAEVISKEDMVSAALEIVRKEKEAEKNAGKEG